LSKFSDKQLLDKQVVLIVLHINLYIELWNWPSFTL